MALAAQAVVGASDQVAVGLIGCGGRGRYVARRMRETAGVEFAAVCDVHQANANRAREWAGPHAQSYGDFRRLLEQKDLDAVLIATPDHWHAAITVLACQAGKEVYVEKPLAHNVVEGRAMVTAARNYKRIVQAGTQQRSAPHFQEVAQLVRGGGLGEVRYVRVWNYLNFFPGGIGRAPDASPPQGMDWDLWLGPAPQVPYNAKRFEYFRWFRDYAGGLITDFGTHRFDTVHQIMGEDAPRSVAAAGWSGINHDAGDIPSLMQVTYEYPGFVLSYECSFINGHGLGGRTPGMHYYNEKGTEDRPHGMAFYGTEGTIFADRIGYEIYPPEGRRPAASKARPLLERKSVVGEDATAKHAASFIQCVRGKEKPAADVVVGHRSTIVGHLGNIALATHRKLLWDAEAEQFTGDAEASAMLVRRAREPWRAVLA